MKALRQWAVEKGENYNTVKCARRRLGVGTLVAGRIWLLTPEEWGKVISSLRSHQE